MDNKINLENLSEEEVYKLCEKTLDSIKQKMDNIHKTLSDATNYCRNLKHFADNYPTLVKSYINSEN
jgi:hypothetical protein